MLQRAWELSQVLKNISLESVGKYKHFDVSYVDCPLITSKCKQVDYNSASCFQLVLLMLLLFVIFCALMLLVDRKGILPV